MPELLSIVASNEAASEVAKVTFKEGFIKTYESAVKESALKELLPTIENNTLEVLKAQNQLLLENRFKELAPTSPLYEFHPSRLEWLKKFENVLKDVDGFEKTKMKTLSANVDSARGSFAELVRAYRSHNAGYEIKDIGKVVNTSLGKTDIDILAYKNGKTYWIENKDVSSKMPLSQENELKVLKMKDGLDNGVMDLKGNVIKIDEAVFINNGEIGTSLMEKAKELGIHIKEKFDGRVYERYMKNLSP